MIFDDPGTSTSGWAGNQYWYLEMGVESQKIEVIYLRYEIGRILPCTFLLLLQLRSVLEWYISVVMS